MATTGRAARQEGGEDGKRRSRRKHVTATAKARAAIVMTRCATGQRHDADAKAALGPNGETASVFRKRYGCRGRSPIWALATSITTWVTSAVATERLL